MAGQTKLRHGLTLEEFLRLPDIEESPTQEFIDGRIVRKAVPKKSHGKLTKMLMNRLDGFAEPQGLGESFPDLRCTYQGRSIVPDVVFLLAEHIDRDEHGNFIEETLCPPDIHIEILSPKQSSRQAREKLQHSTSHGCPLGWFFDPDARTIDVYRPGRPPERLPEDGVLEGEPVLPGFRLPAAEVFGWLTLRKPARGPDAP